MSPSNTVIYIYIKYLVIHHVHINTGPISGFKDFFFSVIYKLKNTSWVIHIYSGFTQLLINFLVCYIRTNHYIAILMIYMYNVIL